MDDLYSQFGLRLRGARRNAGLTQDQLGGAVGLSRTSITNIERGRQHVPLHTLVRLADATGVQPGDLIPVSRADGYRIPSSKLRHLDEHDRKVMVRVVTAATADHPPGGGN